MRLFGKFGEEARSATLRADGRDYAATWMEDPGFVEIPGLTQFDVRVDDAAGEAVLYMRWLVADLRLIGGKEGVLDASNPTRRKAPTGPPACSATATSARPK